MNNGEDPLRAARGCLNATVIGILVWIVVGVVVWAVFFR
jgi:hypothetical protein